MAGVRHRLESPSQEIVETVSTFLSCVVTSPFSSPFTRQFSKVPFVITRLLKGPTPRTPSPVEDRITTPKLFIFYLRDVFVSRGFLSCADVGFVGVTRHASNFHTPL